MCRSYSQFLVYVYVLDYPTINSLCYSVILIPWFLMNYEGRLLQQITDRMVSYNSLSCLCYWISAQVFHNILSLCGHKRRASSPPGTLTQPTPAERLLSCPCPVSFTSTCGFYQESARLRDLVAIRKLSWSWIVARFKFRSDSIFVCS